MLHQSDTASMAARCQGPKGTNHVAVRRGRRQQAEAASAQSLAGTVQVLLVRRYAVPTPYDYYTLQLDRIRCETCCATTAGSSTPPMTDAVCRLHLVRMLACSFWNWQLAARLQGSKALGLA